MSHQSGRRAGRPDERPRPASTSDGVDDGVDGPNTAVRHDPRRTVPRTGEPSDAVDAGPSSTVRHEGHGAGRRLGDRVGVRELRNNVAAVVRRAAAGERIVVTVDGVPAAQLGPLEPSAGPPNLDDLIAAGLVLPPGRRDRPGPPDAEDVPVDARPDAALDELRGR